MATTTLWRPVGQRELEPQYPPQRVGGAGIDELWIPAERLDEFNDHIVGTIALVATYRRDEGRRSASTA
jgi:hypothetical protein